MIGNLAGPVLWWSSRAGRRPLPIRPPHWNRRHLSSGGSYRQSPTSEAVVDRSRTEFLPPLIIDDVPAFKRLPWNPTFLTTRSHKFVNPLNMPAFHYV